MCVKLQAPFRVDHVEVSYVQKLVEAKKNLQKGEITRELTAVEDKAIEKLVEQQKESWIKGFTDGPIPSANTGIDFF